ncbi:hypothetical protein K474DRAFT_460587 [Panus rudis PR-1116 ss-1]|nr:hypothetical protein K474DRAFT_460587 [Panus rudis PR-1116 ss-1]
MQPWSKPNVGTSTNTSYDDVDHISLHSPTYANEESNRVEEIETYRRLLSSMAETCRTLQARIRTLESEVAALKYEQQHMRNSPLSTPTSLSPLLLSPSHSSFVAAQRRSPSTHIQKRENRRHSAPQLMQYGSSGLAAILEVAEADLPPPRPPEQVEDSDVWISYHDQKLLEKALLWY